jgi:aspartate racemase
MHIGLIGGIGPAATIAYYQRLAAEMRRRGHQLDLTIVNADVDTLRRNATSDDRQAQATVYGVLIDRLRAAGADCVAITSLGGHFCLAETAALSSLPIVSAVAPLDAYFVAQGLGTVGLLGTETVMGSRLYGQLAQTAAVVPDNLDAVSETYIEIAISGTCTDAQRALFLAEGAKLISDKGADAVVLAGTDLNLAFDGRDAGYRVVDALDVHVALLADLASGKAELAQHSLGGLS